MGQHTILCIFDPTSIPTSSEPTSIPTSSESGSSSAAAEVSASGSTGTCETNHHAYEMADERPLGE
jgi:hypothetical protein